VLTSGGEEKREKGEKSSSQKEGEDVRDSDRYVPNPVPKKRGKVLRGGENGVGAALLLSYECEREAARGRKTHAGKKGEEDERSLFPYPQHGVEGWGEEGLKTPL